MKDYYSSIGTNNPEEEMKQALFVIAALFCMALAFGGCFYIGAIASAAGWTAETLVGAMLANICLGLFASSAIAASF